jgi:hypothetical protein
MALRKRTELHLAFLLSSVAGTVSNLSLQIVWQKHLRKSSCSASYSRPILWLGLCQTQPAEYWVQLYLCPHRLPFPTPLPTSESFISSAKHGGGATVLGEGRDTVPRETYIPAFLNTNNLGKQLAAFCLSLSSVTGAVPNSACRSLSTTVLMLLLIGFS